MIPDAYTRNEPGGPILAAVLLAAILLAGCSSPSEEGSDVADADADATASASLTDPNAWSVIEASDDPVDDAPDTVMCDPENGTKIEDLNGEAAFGVSTTRCEYVAVRQSTLSPISEGDTVFIRAWHFELTAPEDAEAHLAVALDDETIWEERIPIPSGESGLLTHEWTASRDIPVGSDIVFHAHNHGNNEYYLIEVSRR